MRYNADAPSAPENVALKPQKLRLPRAALADPFMPPNTPAAALKPEFLRLPKSGSRCPYTGLSRSKYNEICLPSAKQPVPPVKSISMRQRGQVKGVRLIVFDSLMAYLHSLADNAGGAADSQSGTPAR